MDNPGEFERRFVHKFYEENSAEFSATRRKHWEMVKRFLDENHVPGAAVLDAGCGNGRSFLVPGVVGVDYCSNLLREAGTAGGSGLVRGDVLDLPFADSSFDLVLSIAVVHHLSTHERRTRAMEEMKRVLRSGGRMLVYVWGNSARGKRKFSRAPGETEDDCFATWNLRSDARRYYHLYGAEELLRLCSESGLKVVHHGSEEESLSVVLEKQ